MATFVNDFLPNFHVFVDLSLIVCSISIRNIKPDGLPVKSMNFGVDLLIEKSMILVGVDHEGESGDVGTGVE